MRKIVILLGIILFMIACEKGNEEVREAKVVVVVYDENGKIATGIPVKMYNEKDYKVFEKDNLTLPTAVARTNESGDSHLYFTARRMVRSTVAAVLYVRGTRRWRT